MLFPKRNFEKIIEEICKKHKIKLTSLNDGWVLKLQKGNNVKILFGYNFPLDNTSISKTCDDKAACSDLLKTYGIQSFEHKYFMKGFYKPKEITEWYNKFGSDVVVKPNVGSSGKDVYHCNSIQELRANIKTILKSHIGFSISPFYNYTFEYRAIMLNHIPMVVYKKVRNESWKHNLALGATISEEIDVKKLKYIKKLASKISKRLGIKFCSIDLAEINNKLIVVEVNSGVMMEKFSQHNYKKAYSIYEKAILHIF